MKYIVLRNKEQEEMIFVFPRVIDHDRMYESIQYTRMDKGREWHRGLAHHAGTVLVSAGFVNDGSCNGKSETLEIASRPVADTALLRAQTGCE